MPVAFTRSKLACALSLLLLAGCQMLTPPNFPSAPTAETTAAGASPSAPPADPTVIEPSATPPAGPDLALLRDATYSLESTQASKFTLVNGEYREPSAVVAAAETVVTFFQAVPGDINQDGMLDAAVVLNVNTGGTGRFFYLYAAVAQGDGFAISAPVYLGDRVIINLLQVDPGQIHLDMIVSGPNDPMCCPNTPATADYTFQDGQLVKIQ